MLTSHLFYQIVSTRLLYNELEIRIILGIAQQVIVYNILSYYGDS